MCVCVRGEGGELISKFLEEPAFHPTGALSDVGLQTAHFFLSFHLFLPSPAKTPPPTPPKKKKEKKPIVIGA